jgi:hypothetical protein
VIIENPTEFESFLEEYKESDCIVIPILSDINLHPLENTLCAIYVKLIDGDEYILPFNHGESMNLDLSLFDELNSDHKKYVYDRKQLNHIVKWDNVIDINLQYYMEYNKPLSTEDISTNSHDYFSRKYYKTKNINRVIPLLKHLELCTKLSNEYQKYIELKVHQEYNDEIIDNLTYIESSGLRHNDKIVYSEYNLYTSTGRPSNRYGGVNFAALNKSDESRKPFKSRFDKGMLVEFDYDAYHLRLIGEVVDYKFPEGSVHEHMSKFYGCDYQESKNLSFRYLYGHIPIEVVQMNPFFGAVHDYINKIWSEYKQGNFITSNIYSKKIYRKNLSEMNRNKLFNYLIQLMETENNMKVLSNLIPFLESYKSKLILYSYDSFLFDFNLDDGVDFLKKIKKIIESNGLFPTKTSKGTNYHEMEDITEKLND